MRFILSEYIKSFFFMFVVYYFTMLFLWFFLVYLRWVFIISLFAVGSEVVAVGDIIIFKNIAFFRNCLSCLFWAFLIERLCGLFVVVVLVIDFAVNWWDGLPCLFWRFVFWVFLIEWLCGLFVDVILFWFFIERLWFGGEEEKLWSDGALQCRRC